MRLLPRNCIDGSSRPDKLKKRGGWVEIVFLFSYHPPPFFTFFINQSIFTMKSLYPLLKQCRGSHRFKLLREIRRYERQAKKNNNSEQTKNTYKKLKNKLTASIEQKQQRLNNLPQPEYPDLPVADRRDEIIKTIAENQVTIICGETGSGKTTQLPKMCLELGRGVDGIIGHTQPRRIAARSVAARIAEELKTELGSVVGYKVRFHDRINDDSYIKLMTDGILLAEIRNDRYLNQYDTLIIDEAHERSLNIDFIIGYLRWLLQRSKSYNHLSHN